MSRKNKKYFNLMRELVGYSSELAGELYSFFCNYDSEMLIDKLEELHIIEHNADKRKHALMAELSMEFITPIEREDIVAIAQNIDDITDGIEDILLKAYMFRIRTMRPAAVEFVRIICNCCEELENVFDEFHNFQKSTKLKDHLIAINDLEEEGDTLYSKTIHDLFGEEDIRNMIRWFELYKQMEDCCDMCERTAGLVESVIMKNS